MYARLVLISTVFLFVVVSASVVGQSQANGQSCGTIVQGPESYSGHTYYVLDASTWTAAEAVAVCMSGHLATIDNAAENAFILGLNGSGSRYLWIGLIDATNTDTFVWISGSSATYRNWYDGEPTDYPNEFYTWIYPGPAQTAGTWNNAQDNPIAPVPYGVVEIGSISVGGIVEFPDVRGSVGAAKAGDGSDRDYVAWAGGALAVGVGAAAVAVRRWQRRIL